MKIRQIIAPLILLGTLLMCGQAIAQEGNLNANTDRLLKPVPKYNLQYWRPAPNPGDYLVTYGSMIDDDHWRLTGGFDFTYAHVPMEIRYADEKAERAVLKNQLYMDLYLSMSLFSWVEIAVSMPFALYESTDFSDPQLPLYATKGASGVGDLRVVVKGKLLDLRQYPVGLALIADLSTPTGTKGKFMSDEAVTFAINAALEFNPWKNSRMAVNLGYRYRPMRDIYGYTLGQAFLISGAAAIPFFHPDLDLLLDMKGEIATQPSDKNLTRDERPFEADLAFRYRFLRGTSAKEWWRGLALTAGVGVGLQSTGSPDVRAILSLNFHWVNGGLLDMEYEYGGYITAVDPCPDPETTPASKIPERCRNVVVDSDGDTIPDKDDRCPFAGRAGFIDEFGCAPDRDGDGIPDYADLCPDEGGRVDRNGCPIKEDSDGDGIYDVDDKCPHEPETFNGYEDEDGCPDADPDALVELTAGKINIKEQVFFETSKAIIKSESFELLDQVAKLLVDNPHIGNVTVEGHTDSRGKYKYTVKLSQDRAESVMKYLVDHGVDPARLNAIGYGPDRPIDSNDTKEGRARNRRVEFVVNGIDDDYKTSLQPK
ncbi:MAG: OmpA family protein [Proteobacteria bacterium]|nr:OmpA family protein [Pseudomonadota bacterium]